MQFFHQSPKIADDFKALFPYLSYLWREPSASEKVFSDSWIAAKTGHLPPGLLSGCALTQVSSMYPCGSHSYLLCCSHVFWELFLLWGFFWGGAITMRMSPCTWASYSDWSWRQEGLGQYMASLKLLICSCLGPRQSPCLLQADFFFAMKFYHLNPSPCSLRGALGGVCVPCRVVYLTVWPGTWW